MQSFKNGTVLGAYTVVRLIGRGGMGEVYEAYESRLERRVALKVIAPQKAGSYGEVDLVRRFLQEARTLAQVNHPNVVTIYSIDQISDTPIIAMEFVDGASFKDIFSMFALSADEAAPLFMQLLEGLRSLHDNRILHRDIKPHNLMLRPNGQVKILDFGIAKRLGDREQNNTTAGVVVGTLAYLPPEVLYGQMATARSDLWSMGAIFYECLVGQPLVSMHTMKVKGVKAATESDVVFPEDCLGWIPPEMRAIIAKLCDRRPDFRYQNASEAIDAIKRFQLARPPLPPGAAAALYRMIEDIEDVKKTMDRNKIADPRSKRALTLQLLGGPTERPVEVSRPITKEMGATEMVVDSLSARRRAQISRRLWRRLQRPAAILAGALLVTGLGYKIISSRVREAAKHTQSVVVESLHLVSPTENQTLWLEPTQIPTLSWSTMVTSGDYELQIASDANFNSIVVREPVSGVSYRPGQLLPEGQYHWQLWPIRGQLKAIGPGHFTLSFLSGLEPIWPKAEQVFELARKSKLYSLSFSWNCKPGARTYRAQVSSDPTFTSLVDEHVVTACNWNDVSLPTGSFFWRVRVEEPVEAQGSSSNKLGFTIKSPLGTSLPSQALHAPAPTHSPAPVVGHQLASPHVKSSAQTVTLMFKKPLNVRDPASVRRQMVTMPVFSWNPVAHAHSYNLQISWTSDFTRLLSEENVSNTHYEWTEAVPGHLYWRVRAVSNEGVLTSAYSHPASVNVRLPNPELGSVYTFTEKAPFEWDPVPLAEKYVVQWSSSRSLASVTEKVTSDPQVALEMGKAPIYVRVASATDTGVRVSGFSQVATVTLEEPLRLLAPGIITPPKGAKVVVGKSGRISIVFSWTKVDKATQYVIEVANSPKFSKLIQQKAVTTNHWLLKEAKFNGKVYWRVRTESAGGHSKWSQLGTFEVR